MGCLFTLSRGPQKDGKRTSALILSNTFVPACWTVLMTVDVHKFRGPMSPSSFTFASLFSSRVISYALRMVHRRGVELTVVRSRLRSRGHWDMLKLYPQESFFFERHRVPAPSLELTFRPVEPGVQRELPPHAICSQDPAVARL